MHLRMAMDKLKQALGFKKGQISDDQLMALLRKDAVKADPYNEFSSGPIFEDLKEYPAEEIAEAIQEMQGGLVSDPGVQERMYGYDPRR